MRESVSFKIQDPASFKMQLLEWCRLFSTCCLLDSNKWEGSAHELIAGAEAISEISTGHNSFEELKRFHQEKRDWIFGHLSYDLKNETENLTSRNFDGLQSPMLYFFQPKYVFILDGNTLNILFLQGLSTKEEMECIYREILSTTLSPPMAADNLEIKHRISGAEYETVIGKIKDHIRLGDIYEMNYCMEFFAEDAAIDPPSLFLKLSEASQTPFAAYYRNKHNYLICSSPERFLKKTGQKITSQPIKGTAGRGKNQAEDVLATRLLAQSEKEKSENVMIVDLVRNDLSRTCKNVKVEELFGIYTFKRWHQMISTVTGDLRTGTDFTEPIKASFPMGSMTGAPKVKAMELIEKYERTRRGLYSGSLGYISPEADFDFNVVIRSILYNSESRYLSFQVGSAITARSEPKHEYKECLLKAQGMFEALKITDEREPKSNRPEPQSYAGPVS